MSVLNRVSLAEELVGAFSLSAAIVRKWSSDPVPLAVPFPALRDDKTNDSFYRYRMRQRCLLMISARIPTMRVAWYDENAEAIVELHKSLAPERVNAWLADVLPNHPALVLDVGAGSGAARLGWFLVGTR